MKIWIVGQGYYHEDSQNVGVHQVEEYAQRQADDLMAVGEWGDAYVHVDEETGRKSWCWTRDYSDIVYLEEWELSY